MGFWDSMFGGQNSVLNTNIGTTGQVAGYGIGKGEKNLSTASDWWNSIISGDSSKTSQVLAPAIDAAKTSTAQDIKTSQMFGPRSGGTAASNAASADKTHGYIADLIGQLTGSAVSGLASTGGAELTTGLEATGMQTEMAQQRMQNWNKSILGQVTHQGTGTF